MTDNHQKFTELSEESDSSDSFSSSSQTEKSVEEHVETIDKSVEDSQETSESAVQSSKQQISSDIAEDPGDAFVFVDSDAPEGPSSMERLTDALISRWQQRQEKHRAESEPPVVDSSAVENNKEPDQASGADKQSEIFQLSDTEFDIIGADGGVVPKTEVEEEMDREVEHQRRRSAFFEEQELVMLPVPDIVVFPGLILPVSIETESSIKAVEYALENDTPLFLITKRQSDSSNIAKTTLYKTGCICASVQAARLHNGSFRLVLHGILRAKVKKITSRKPFAKVRLEVVHDIISDKSEIEAAMQVVAHQFRQVASLSSNISPELAMAMSSVRNPGQIADLVAVNLGVTTKEKQSVLDTLDVCARLHKVSVLLSKEIEVLKIENKIQNKAEMEMMKGHKEYFLRQQIKAIQEELGDSVDEGADVQRLKEGIAESGMPPEAAEHASKEVKRLSRMSAASPDYNMIYTYVERLLQFPWNKTTQDILDLKKAEAILNEEHYGLKEVKERILEFLSVRKLKENHRGSIICFVGPPGVGKTSLGRSIARTMGRKFNRTSLGGVRDEAEIRGHRSTYIGSMPGRIIQAMCSAGARNPVIMLDEIDKLGNDYRGDPSAALLEALDPEQNKEFKDNYYGIPVDLSAVMFIMTANVLDTIPPALRDRMEVIRLSGYTLEEKMEIAKGFLIPRQIEENGLTGQLFSLTDEALRCVIKEYTREAGVRSLEREIAGLCRKVARKITESRRPRRKLKTLTIADVRELLGTAPYTDSDKLDIDPIPGCVQGLSWTQVGGEMLTIETNIIPGKGRMTLTGNLGQVMKESAKAAVTWGRSFLNSRGIDFDYYKHDIHIHVPEGAIPKDGPSAGITLASSFISAALGKPARQDIAMTGEITLTGRVMAIGGVKEKVLAAFNSSIREVILPEENRRHLQEIPDEIRSQITFHFVKHADEVIDIVMTGAK
ncbi:MAG: endopeptidase La [Candidatus Bruticola sp.]